MRTLLVTSVLTAALTASCSRAEPDRSDESAIGDLQVQMERLQSNDERLDASSRRVNRRLDELTREVARLSSARVAAPASPGAADDTGLADGDASSPTADASEAEGLSPELERLLETEEGRKAIEQAAAAAVARREREQRTNFIRYKLERFAEKADLDDHQRREVIEVWDDTVSAVRKMMADVRSAPDQSPAARQQRMADAVTEMGRLRDAANERVRLVLDDGQWEMYEKEEEDILSGLHGGSAPTAGDRSDPGRTRDKTGSTTEPPKRAMARTPR